MTDLIQHLTWIDLFGAGFFLLLVGLAVGFKLGEAVFRDQA